MSHRTSAGCEATSRPSRWPGALPCAFTLVELLVVIAILSLLLSILTPSLARAKYLVKRAMCLSNVHQQAAALLTYATANRGVFNTASRPDPQYVRHVSDTSGWWWTMRDRYLKDSHVLICPILGEAGAGGPYSNMAYALPDNSYGSWDSGASFIFLPYAWIAGFPITPAAGEPGPSTNLYKADPDCVLITHRASISPSIAGWDIDHQGLGQWVPPSYTFDRFLVTDQPVGYLDGHTESHSRDQIKLRFTFAPPQGYFVTEYYY